MWLYKHVLYRIQTSISKGNIIENHSLDTPLFSPFFAICTDHASKSDQKDNWVKIEDNGSFAKHSYFGQNNVSRLVTWQKSYNSPISSQNIRVFVISSKWAIFCISSFFRLLTEKNNIFRMCNFLISRNAITFSSIWIKTENFRLSLRYCFWRLNFKPNPVCYFIWY